MENTKSTFDAIMENCPFLKGVIEDKIKEEVESRDSKIESLEEVAKELTQTILMLGGTK